MAILPERSERSRPSSPPRAPGRRSGASLAGARPRRRGLAGAGRPPPAARRPPAAATRSASSCSPTSASFAGLVLGIAAAARLLQRRPAGSLLGPGGFRPRDFALGVAVIALIGAVSASPWRCLAPPVRQLPLAAWAAWLPLALPALLVQTAAEELAFRGYPDAGPRRALPLAAGSGGSCPRLLFGAPALEPGRVRPERLDRRALRPPSSGSSSPTSPSAPATSRPRSACTSPTTSVSLLLVALPSPLAGLSLYLARIDPADAAAVRPAPPRRPRHHARRLGGLARLLRAGAGDCIREGRGSI